MELITRHGLMRAAVFGRVGVTVEADVTSSALDAVAASLTRGALKTQAARNDRALVRRELDAAFRLSAAAEGELTDVFGADGAKSFADGSAKGSANVVAPADLRVIVPHIDGTREVRRLVDVIGTRVAGDNPDLRAGPYAWSDVAFTARTPADVRAYFKRVQRALHANVPLPIGWYFPDNADPKGNGEFRKVPSEPGSEADSVDHETILTDYEIDGVPGFGRLQAGKPATEAQKTAALDDAAKVVFFRVTDSYGVVKGKQVKKTDDLYVDYLLGTVKTCPTGAAPTSSKCTSHVPLEDVTFPAGF